MKRKTKNMDYYTTTDLGLASLLYAEGVQFVGLVPKEGTWEKEMAFTPAPEDLVLGWQRGTVEVNAAAFWRASRVLKRKLKDGS